MLLRSPGIEFPLPGVFDHRPGSHQPHQPLFPQVVLAQVPGLLLGQTKFLQAGFQQTRGPPFIVSAQRGRDVRIPGCDPSQLWPPKFPVSLGIPPLPGTNPCAIPQTRYRCLLLCSNTPSLAFANRLHTRAGLLVVATPNDANSGPCRSATTRPCPPPAHCRKTAPPIVFQSRILFVDYARTRRIKMNVVADAAAIFRLLAIDHHRLVAPLKDVPSGALPCVEPRGIGRLKPLHPSDKICSQRVQQQMIVIVHHTWLCTTKPARLQLSSSVFKTFPDPGPRGRSPPSGRPDISRGRALLHTRSSALVAFLHPESSVLLTQELSARMHGLTPLTRTDPFDRPL